MDDSHNADGLLQQCIKAIKRETPGLLVIADVAMDPYSSAGHDGFVTQEGTIDNDITIDILCRMAVEQARAGADVVSLGRDGKKERKKKTV